MTKLNKMTFAFLGLFAVTLIVADPAHANNFSSIAKNMTTSIASLPTLLAALSYLFGLLLGVLGVMKIKDHVENPGQTPLKDGAIRLAAGGALFAIPMLYEAAKNTIGSGAATSQATLTSLTFP
ncbi:MAG: hypothetical protein HYU57_09095 [Micavibrio aeruginosavorus]|nr:hypothetical protein [Micavibrio aeruginosavorus]